MLSPTDMHEKVVRCPNDVPNARASEGLLNGDILSDDFQVEVLVEYLPMKPGPPWSNDIEPQLTRKRITSRSR